MYKTVLVTGGTGYVGSWVTKNLLEKGYAVRLAVRDKSKEQKYKHLFEIEKKTEGTLELWEADLLKDGSFDQAAEGSDALMHIASPFKLNIKDPQTELVDPALKGTRNVLGAASKSSTVKKVVLTSSVVAVHGDNIDMTELGIDEFTEEHFNYSSSLSHQPYPYSKVLAEKEAWKIHDAQSDWKLVVMNPSFVMGPSLTKSTASESLNFMTEILKGKYYTGVPHLQISFVDVRDVASAHIAALENDNAKGRHILSERTESMFNFTQLIKKKYGDQYKLPLMESPKFMLYILGWMYGVTVKFISRNVGHPLKVNNSKSKKELGVVYTPIEQTIEDMVEQMKKDGIV